MKVGEKVKSWRLERGLSQRDAAKAAGISQAAWQAIETGRTPRIGLDVAERVVTVTQGVVVLADFPRPKGKRVRPVPAPAESGPDVTATRAAS